MPLPRTPRARRKAKIAREVRQTGAALNERRLFHGADKNTLAIIVK